MRRSWRTVEASRARAPREHFAPAAVVARAVGAFVLEVATHDAGAAAAGAVAGCTPGVSRMVDVSLARLVLDALPGRAATASDAARGDTAPPRSTALPVSDGRWPSRTRVPPPAWWSRESGWSPRLVNEPSEEEAGLGPLWPRVPGGPPRPAERRVRASGPTSERRLMEHAWRMLEQEVEPASRRMGAVGGVP